MPTVLIFANRDLASNYFLNLLLPHLKAYTIHVFLSDSVGGKKKILPEALTYLNFFEQTLPNEILFPQLEAQNRPVEQLKFCTFGELSRKYGISITSMNDVQSSENLAFIAALKPDLALSVRYGKIFKEGFLQIPTRGTINLHSGLLPQYRGVLATFRALLNGDAEIGTTLHYIDDGNIDTGGIIGNAKINIDENACLLSHILRLYPASVDLVAETIHALLSDKPISTISQTHEQAAYYTFPNESELQAFRETGRTFVNPGLFSDFLDQYVV